MNRLHLATTGLFAAWLVHDLEELATMSASSRALAKRLPDWLPVAASVRGRSAFYQNVLLGFGLHGLGHIGVSLLARGYTSGIATAPTDVVPFWLWASRELQQAGVPNRRSLPVAIAVTAGTIAGARLAAYAITKNQP
jgi:hypothetical protein